MRKLCCTLSPCAPAPAPSMSAPATMPSTMGPRLLRLIIAITIMVRIAIPHPGLAAAGHRLLDQRIGGEAAVDHIVPVILRQHDRHRAVGRPGERVGPVNPRIRRHPERTLAGDDDAGVER